MGRAFGRGEGEARGLIENGGGGGGGGVLFMVLQEDEGV